MPDQGFVCVKYPLLLVSSQGEPVLMFVSITSLMSQTGVSL